MSTNSSTTTSSSSSDIDLPLPSDYDSDIEMENAIARYHRLTATNRLGPPTTPLQCSTVRIRPVPERYTLLPGTFLAVSNEPVRDPATVEYLRNVAARKEARELERRNRVWERKHWYLVPGVRLWEGVEGMIDGVGIAIRGASRAVFWSVVMVFVGLLAVVVVVVFAEDVPALGRRPRAVM